MRKILVLSLVVLIVIVSGCINDTNIPDDNQIINDTEILDLSAQDKVDKFSTCTEMKEFIKTNFEADGYYRTYAIEGEMTVTTGATESTSGSAASTDYSTTNIQVEGVDEADIVKNDGKYIYVVSGKKVVIVNAYPVENAEILSEIDFDYQPHEIFINGDKLIVFGNENYNYDSQKMFIKTYDLSNRSAPVLERNLTIDGNYYDSRMIGDYVYSISTNHIYSYTDDIRTPEVYENGIKTTCACSDVYYFDVPDYSYQFTTILALDTQDVEEDVSTQVFLMGSAQNLYVSQDNIYTTYSKRISNTEYKRKMVDQVYVPILPEDIVNKIYEIREMNISQYSQEYEIDLLINQYVRNLEVNSTLHEEIQNRLTEFRKQINKELQKSVIHKISIDEKNIEYMGQGDVPGYILNQFSMDEFNDNFRVATTTGSFWWGGSEQVNNVYVLNSDLEIIGETEDLAPGERIYSARFIGNRAYLVTFRQVDPFYVIDLSEPTNPEVLGYLKIPGFSNYLHPYDENHIIGIGKETVGGNDIFAWQQGVKISLFDVTDVSNPVQKSKYVIGHRGTDSIALDEHKAFLFDKEKGFLTIPIWLSLVNESEYPEGIPDWASGKRVWNGLYVLDINLEDGIQYRGRITHENETEDYNYYKYQYSDSILRSLYMDDVLYTISNRKIKMNNLNSIEEINEISLPYDEKYYYWYGWR
ncbi:MAG: beta-propeller domain-containing protein [Nanoarchaeota archaeon]|nr:beta-propeller domain-containing protein [Nanoarchaeota archaeon]